MWIRSRLDILWRDLLVGFASCFRPDSREAACHEVTESWGRDRDLLVTLSVRSSFDLLLRSLNLPSGSEVLFTAVTIPGMIEIARHHGLTPIPVDIDRDGKVCLRSLEAAISDRTEMLVVAHLFGSRVPLDNINTVLRGRDILLVEDCAQSFTEVGESGDLRSDAVMHSFGPIKTATALGGAIVEVRSRSVFSEMQRRLGKDPMQSRFQFAKRVVRFAALKLLTLRIVAGGLFIFLRRLGIEPDRAFGNIARGFAASDLIRQIRYQPSAPQMRLISRRFRHYDFGRIAARAAGGRRLDAALEINRDVSHSYWAYPVWVKGRERVRDELRRQGFDATWETRLIVVPSTTGHATPQANEMWSRVLFLPCYPELTERAMDQMAKIVAGVAADDPQASELEAERTPRRYSAVRG